MKTSCNINPSEVESCQIESFPLKVSHSKRKLPHTLLLTVLQKTFPTLTFRPIIVLHFSHLPSLFSKQFM